MKDGSKGGTIQHGDASVYMYKEIDIEEKGETGATGIEPEAALNNDCSLH